MIFFKIIWLFYLKSVIFQHHFILKSVNGTGIEANFYIFLALHKSFFCFLRLYKQNSILKTNIKPMSDE